MPRHKQKAETRYEMTIYKDAMLKEELDFLRDAVVLAALP